MANKKANKDANKSVAKTSEEAKFNPSKIVATIEKALFKVWSNSHPELVDAASQTINNSTPKIQDADKIDLFASFAENLFNSGFKDVIKEVKAKLEKGDCNVAIIVGGGIVPEVYFFEEGQEDNLLIGSLRFVRENHQYKVVLHRCGGNEAVIRYNGKFTVINPVSLSLMEQEFSKK